MLGGGSQHFVLVTRLLFSHYDLVIPRPLAEHGCLMAVGRTRYSGTSKNLREPGLKQVKRRKLDETGTLPLEPFAEGCRRSNLVQGQISGREIH